MFSFEIDYLVHKEIYKSRQQELAHRQLIQIAKFQQPDNSKSLRRIVGWIGAWLVKQGAKLQGYDRGQHQTLIQRG